jgi:hypothetical protein
MLSQATPQGRLASIDGRSPDWRSEVDGVEYRNFPPWLRRSLPGRVSALGRPRYPGPFLTMPGAVPILKIRMSGMTEPRTPIIIP